MCKLEVRKTRHICDYLFSIIVLALHIRKIGNRKDYDAMALFTRPVESKPLL